MNKVNEYSIKPLNEDEIFSFKVILCDNQIDRDFERFSIDSLFKLEQLFKGKTGIFDHNPKTDGQMARIYDTKVEVNNEKITSAGEIYHALTAHAYMVRCAKNGDLIKEIQAGIKKEVSVGCSVEKTVCSVCGNDVKTQTCSHKKGDQYDNEMCHHILQNPTDAYEWSFVAVPAQIGAGVTKKFALQDEEININKLGISDVYLTQTESINIKSYIQKLEKKAIVADKYKQELLAEVIKLGYLAYPEMTSEVLSSIGQKLDIDELNMLKKSFIKNTPLASPQLMGNWNNNELNNTEFSI